MILELTTVRTRLRASSDQDAALTAVIKATEALWFNRTGSLLEAANLEKRHRPIRMQGHSLPYDPTLYLDSMPVGPNAGDFLILGWNDGEDEPTDYGATDLVAGEHYVLNRERASVELLTSSRDNYKTKMNGGFTTATIPADIAEALYQQVAYLWVREDLKTIAAEQVSVAAGGAANLRSGSIHPLFKAVSRDTRYRRDVV